MSRPGPAGAAPAARPAPDLTGWTIGIVGLGTMGAAMAGRLARSGATLRLYNRNADRARSLAAGGAAVAASPAEASDAADLVLISVADDASLSAVVAGPAGVARAAIPPGLVLNTSTVAPGTVRSLAADVPLLDAGVLGNGEHARDGLLRWYVGGDAALLDRARPVLDALGRQIVHVGPLGSGMTLKLAMNLLMGLEMQALAEVIAWGVAGGLDRLLVLDTVLNSGLATPVMQFKARRMIGESYEEPDFRLRLMAKDLALAQQEAAAAGAGLPMTAAAAGAHDRAVRDGAGDADCAVIARYLERQVREAAR
jgi:3-hydroxyisobutyrate dehydrogenase